MDRALQPMLYPTRNAQLLVKQLGDLATQSGVEVFTGDLETCTQGEDYRSFTVDVTRNDWRRIQPKLLANGWKPFGGEALVYSLPEGTFVIADPNF